MKRGIRREKGNNRSRHFDFNEKLHIFSRRQKKPDNSLLYSKNYKWKIIMDLYLKTRKLFDKSKVNIFF